MRSGQPAGQFCIRLRCKAPLANRGCSVGCRRSYFSLARGGSSGGHNPKVHAIGLPQSPRVILQYRPAADDRMPGCACAIRFRPLVGRGQHLRGAGRSWRMSASMQRRCPGVVCDPRWRGDAAGTSFTAMRLPAPCACRPRSMRLVQASQASLSASRRASAAFCAAMRTEVP